MKRIELRGRKIEAVDGDVLFRQGDPHVGIFVINHGIVRTYFISPTGREMTLAYWQPGNFVGGPDVFDELINMWSGVAVGKVEALALSGAVLRRLALEIPRLAVNLIDAQAFKGRWFSAVIQMLGTRSVNERLAQLLLTMADFYGAPTAEGIVIGGGFTHDDLARMVGASRQWVTTTLDRFRDMGTIYIRKRQIVLVNPSNLMRLLSS